MTNPGTERHSGWPEPSLIKVAVVEDLQDIREGLAVLIDGTDGLRCVGTFGTMEEALRRIPADLPDVALVDIGLPGMSGIDGIRILKNQYPRLVMLTLTIYEDDRRILDALCAGATGYLLKKTPPAKLIECIGEAVGGGSPMSPEIARRVITLFRDFAPPVSADYRLTPHELRVLKLLVEGHQYKTAAAELGVSIGTIRFHMQHIYEKLQVHSKSEAVAKALRGRLLA